MTCLLPAVFIRRDVDLSLPAVFIRRDVDLSATGCFYEEIC